MDASAAPEEARRPSIEKMAAVVVEVEELAESGQLDQLDQPFERLPEEIIEQILLAVDANGFASLVVLNRQWRHVSQRSHLYRHHLARCPAYVAKPSRLPSAEEKSLPRLRRLFAREVKRNLLEAYMRPRETLVKLISNSISSSSCPGGESLSFSTSLRGHHILAYNSSRIHIIDVRGPRVEVKRELKIVRRPASVCITDDASLLAMLSTEMQVDAYDLRESPPKRKQSIILDNNPRTIALSSCGSVLAAAYEGGIEVLSLSAGALPTERRAVKCDAVDALTFSFDGTQILGSTLHSSPPSTVVITAPYYDPGNLISGAENLSVMWTTSILFPNSSRDCSHASLLQDGQEEAAWSFAYDRSFETFRAVRIDDLRNGTTYFTGPVPKSQAQLLPSTLPSATYDGELVSAAFHGSEIWLYGVPEDPAAVFEKEPASSGEGVSSSLSSGPTRRNSSHSGSRPSSTRTHEAAAAAAAAAVAAAASATNRAPQWQMLCDRVRNHFVAGQKVSRLSGVTNVKWISGLVGGNSLRERLVVAARGITVPGLVCEEDDLDYVDGGRMILLDFDYGLSNGTRTEETIEVGTDDAEVLEEEKRDMETEVAIVRRRTLTQRRGGGGGGGGGGVAAGGAAGGAAGVGTGAGAGGGAGGGEGGGGTSLLRVATLARALASHRSSQTSNDETDNGDDDDDPLVPRTLGRNPASAQARDDAWVEEDSRLMEELEALDAPYAHSSPRSGMTLRRAASAAAANRRLHPRTADGRPIEYRRADGRREHPHESDADNWVPPPPPYQADDPGDLPAFLRAPAVLAATRVSEGVTTMTLPSPLSPVPAAPTLPSPLSPVPAAPTPVRPPTIPPMSAARRAQHSLRSSRQGAGITRHASAVSSLQTDEAATPSDAINLYDISPPESPRAGNSHRGSGRAECLSPETLRALASLPTHALPSVSELIGRESLSSGRPSMSSIADAVLGTTSTLDPGSQGHESSSAPLVRRLSTVQTWPLQARSIPGESGESGESEAVLDDSQEAAPEDSADVGGRRISRGSLRRLTGSLRAHDRASRQQGLAARSGMYQQSSASVPTLTRMEPQGHDIEQPLIISTPAGVSGAYDPPGRRISRRSEMPILAPVPRRPRTDSAGQGPRSAVDRLETIFHPKPVASSVPGGGGAAASAAPGGSGGAAAAAGTKKSNSRLLPAWIAGTPGRSASTINRRPSRAGRSAAKNMQDARKRGWKRSKSQKKKKKKSQDEGGQGDAVWTDVATSPIKEDKGRKCMMM